MSGNVIAFPKRIEPDVQDRFANEHMLLALDHRDARIAAGDGLACVNYTCFHAAIQGAVDYLSAENPHLTNAELARRLGQAVLDYCRIALGVAE